MEPSARVSRGSVYVTRACDSCKRRKIKCDAGQPCTSCQASDDHCSYIIVPRKRGRVSRRPAEIPLTTSPARHDRIEAPINLVVRSNERSIPTTSIGRESPNFEYSASPTGRVSFLAHDPVQEARSIRTGFVEDVAGLLVSGTLEDLVSHCIDLFMQYIFPTTPVCHESTLRAGVVLFRLDTLMDATPYPLSAKTFTLVTALCALVMAVAPESYIPQRALLAVVFLRASRAMLLNYQNHDLEHPDWTSLTIRVWQSSATQNTTGKDGEAHHYYSEASVLALRLRLYDESSVNRKPPLEAQLLRSNFWQLYLSDKSAAILDNRCRIITEQAFDGELTLLERSSPEVPLLDTTRKEHSSLFESRFHEGHLLKRRIWRDAGNLITAIKSNDQSRNTSHLMHLYLDFSGLTDSFPQWLWKPDQYLDGEIGTETAKYYKTCFWAQRSTIMLPYHILKLVILQTCIDYDAPGAIGLDCNVLSWQQRKMDISRDFLCELQMVPFECIKMQGEPSVQRLRKVGTILLELIRTANNQSITTRAQSQLAQLLDVLARLDSRASDWLL